MGYDLGPGGPRTGSIAPRSEADPHVGAQGQGGPQTSPSMRITLVHPPDGAIPTAPYSSIPHLTGVLKQHGHEVPALDASLETLLFMLDRERLESWWDAADALRAELAANPDRTPEETHEHRRLQRLLSLPRETFAEVEDAVRVMRDKDRFGQPEHFNRAFDVVRLCSHFGFSLHPDNYYDGRRVAHQVLETPTPSPLPDPPLLAFEAFVDEILKDEPDAVGITCPFDASVFFGLKFARILKDKRPDLPVLMGGAGIDSQAYKVLSDPFYFQVLDYVMLGEGEVQFPRLLDVIAEQGDPSTVRNLRWLKEDGTLGVTELELVTDLNAVAAPDFSNLPLGRYLLPDPVATLQSSRGCYYGKCTFCSELFRKGFRIRKPDLVVEDMVSIYEQTGIRHFQLWDSLAPPKTLKKVALEVKKRGLPFEWMAETKFEKPYRDEKMIKTLAEGGCTFLQFGFESASSRVLDLIDKGNDVQDTEIILALMKKYGIRAGTTWFIGFPGESEREADLTHDFVATRRDRVLLSSYTRTFDIGTDTIVFEDAERFGIEIFEVADGVLDYRNKDGSPRWDPDERDQAYHVRGDFYMLKNNIELHYSKVPQDVALEISGQRRVGPVLRQIPQEMLPTVQMVFSPDARYRVYDEHPERPGDGPFGVAVHSITGFRFDLEKPSLAIVKAIDGTPMTYPEVLAATGLDDELARDLVDQGVNRGLIKLLVDEQVLEWVPEALLREEPLAATAGV